MLIHTFSRHLLQKQYVTCILYTAFLSNIFGRGIWVYVWFNEWSEPTENSYLFLNIVWMCRCFNAGPWKLLGSNFISNILNVYFTEHWCFSPTILMEWYRKWSWKKKTNSCWLSLTENSALTSPTWKMAGRPQIERYLLSCLSPLNFLFQIKLCCIIFPCCLLFCCMFPCS